MKRTNFFLNVDMIGNFNFTPFEEGVKTTYNWYSEQNG